VVNTQTKFESLCIRHLENKQSIFIIEID